MKYELIPADVVEEAYLALVDASHSLEDEDMILRMEHAYKSLNRNRTAVNVQPNLE